MDISRAYIIMFTFADDIMIMEETRNYENIKTFKSISDDRNSCV